MLVRRTFATLLGALILLAGLTAPSQASAEELSIGTLAPKKSPWGKVFSAWSKAVKKKTDGKLKLKWYWNGSQGGEEAMVAKMRAGQLDGAAMTSTGLSKIDKKFSALQMPGLCADWGCVDRVRDGVYGELQSMANAQGFYLLGKGDVGLARTFSKGKAVKSPSDLRAMKVWGSASDPMSSTIGSVLGYTPVKKTVPSLLPAITSGQVNAATAPALAATQLQWASHFTHVAAKPAAGVIGGLVISKKKLDGLPGDVRDILKKSGKKAGKMLTKRIRKEDEKAFKLVSGKMTVVTLGAAEEAKFKSMFKKVRRQLGQGTFPSSWVSKLEGLR
jgi:TRAP-type transport system periplasmic protein